MRFLNNHQILQLWAAAWFSLPLFAFAGNSHPPKEEYEDHQSHTHEHEELKEHQELQEHEPEQEQEQHEHGDSGHREHPHAGGGHGEHDSHDVHAEQVQIESSIAHESGITTEIVNSGKIERHAQVYGRVETPPDQQAHVQARFPGLIQAVRVNVGDTVKKGDELAVVESNASLQSYSVRAPIDGVVQSRHANTGETTGTTALFTLLDNSRVWAVFKIFPGLRHEVKTGQTVHVFHNNHHHQTTIAIVTPSSGDQPFVLARVVLNNDYNDLAPGDLVSGDIDVEIVQVPVIIDNRALQTVRNASVVFVKEQNDRYSVRPVSLGLTDGRHTQVLSGLHTGESYVVGNSYLLKADLEKAGAAHHH